MRSAVLYMMLFISLSAGGQMAVKTEMHCGTKNDKAREQYKLGNKALEANGYKQAMVYYRSAIKLDSGFCDAWDNLSVCYRSLGQYDAAFDCGLASLSIDSVNATGWTNCGYAAFLAKKVEKALTTFGQFQRILPDNPGGYYGMSLVLYSVDRYPEAYQNISKAEDKYMLKNMPVEPEVDLLKGLLEYKIGDKRIAQYLFEKIYAYYANNAELNYYLGQCILENENNSAKAGKYIDKAHRLGYK